MEIFEEKMAVFGFEKHQEFLTYFKTLKGFGLTVKDVEAFLDKRHKVVQQEEEALKKKIAAWNKRMPRCPGCSSIMGLFSVNTISANQTEDASKSMWLCTNKNCLHTIYNKESVNLIYEKQLLKKSLRRGI